MAEPEDRSWEVGQVAEPEDRSWEVGQLVGPVLVELGPKIDLEGR